MLSNNEMVMPVAPMGSYGSGGFGGFGGDWGWIILLLLCAGGGWGGFGGFGGFGGMGGLAADGAMLYPWMNQVDVTTSGFQNAATNQAISSLQNSVTSGFGDVQTALCGGFAGVNANIANGFAQAEIGENARQMANMQTAFASQTANAQGFNTIGTGIADLKYTIATENCADRQALNEGVRDIIANQTAGTQRILDKLCDQELQAERRENQNLRSELMYARGQASQIEQTAQIIAGQTAEVDALYNRLSNCPVPSTPVYGRTPIFTCSQNSCGCGSY